MRTKRRRRVGLTDGIAPVLVVLALAGSARAQSLRMGLSDDTSLGNSVSLVVEVTNAPPGGSLSLPEVDGLEISGPSPGARQTMIVNGTRRDSIRYSFTITPKKGGTFTIGPVTWSAPGHAPQKTGTTKLTVNLSLRVEAQASATSKAGEIPGPFRVDYVVRYPAGTADAGQLAKLDLPILEVQGAVVRSVPMDSRRRSVPLRLSGGTVIHTQALPREGSTDGFAISFEVIPMRPGRLDIPGASGTIEIRTGRTRVEQDFVFSRRVAETLPLEFSTEGLTYEVAPLPTAGRPAGFTGAVGKFRITASTEDRRVQTYDPIRLEIRVEALAPTLLDDLPAPNWNEIPELTASFDILTDVDAGTVDESVKTFRQTFRAKTADVTAIPPLPFPYYDSDARQYAVAWSEAIPIEVTQAEQFSATETERPESGSVAATESDAAPARLVRLHGVQANFEERGAPSALADERAAFTSPAFLATLALPPLAFVVFLIALRLFERSPEERSRSRALGTALAGLGAAKDELAASAALQDFFRDRFGLPPGEITPDQLARELAARQVPAERVAAARSLLDRLLVARFGGQSQGVGALIDEAGTLVKAIEKDVR